MENSNLKSSINKGEIEIDLFAVLTQLGEKKKLLFGIPLILAVLVGIYASMMTPTFTARTTFLPPHQQQSTASAMLEQLGPLAGAAASAAGIKNAGDLYIAFLHSNPVLDNLIEKFGLVERYHQKSKADTRTALGRRVEIAADKLSGLISIEVSDGDPQFAADLANAHLDALHLLMGKLAITEAQQRRLFFEDQVEKISIKPFRDIRVQEAILASLMRQYELARIDESREGPMIQQIDRAFPPERKSKPQRLMMVLGSGMFGFLLSCIFILGKWAIFEADPSPLFDKKLQKLRLAWRL